MKKHTPILVVALSFASLNAAAFDGGRGMHLALMEGQKPITIRNDVTVRNNPNKEAKIAENEVRKPNEIRIRAGDDFITIPAEKLIACAASANE